MNNCPRPDKRKFGNRVSAEARAEQLTGKERKGGTRFREVTGKRVNVYKCQCGFWHIGHTNVNRQELMAEKDMKEFLRRLKRKAEQIQQSDDAWRRRWAKQVAKEVALDKSRQELLDEFEKRKQERAEQQQEYKRLADEMAERDLRRNDAR